MVWLYVLGSWNFIVSLVYGYDKLQAKQGKRRVREVLLLSLAFAFGGVGAMFGMILFNHKTSKLKFRFLVPVFAVLNVAIIGYIFGAVMF